MIDFQIIEQIKQASRIYDIVNQYLPLKKEGADYVCKCPFHKENSPSFKVSPSRNKYKCFGCGKSGDSIDFLMSYRNQTYVESLKILADKYRITLEIEPPKKTYVRPIKKANSIKKPFIKSLQDRGISENTINEFHITHAIEWMPKAKAEIEVVCFNYFIEDELINIKYRGADKDFKLSKDAQLIFYNLNSIKEGDYCIIVEGEVDCLTVHECGLKNVISVPNGAGTGSQKLEYLDNCWEYFKNIDQIVLFTDNDVPGQNLQEELARRLGKNRCLKVAYPEDCKDPNEILLKHGKNKLLECIKNATEFPIDGIISMDEMMDDVVNFYHNGYPSGIKVGIEGFDDYISFMLGQITIITGIPSSGKSEFLDYIVCRAILNHGWPFAMCSFENQPSSLHVTKLFEKIGGKSFGFRHDPSHRLTEQDILFGAGIVDKYVNFLHLSQIDVTVDGLLEKCKELVQRRGIKGVLIDPWNYIEHHIPSGQTETQYISESLTKIKAFALKYGVHIFLIAHPTKLKKENGKFEVPNLYSISGSAHFFNKTDNGICVYRNFDTNIVDIHVQKIRYNWCGQVGTISYNFNTQTRQYQLVNN